MEFAIGGFARFVGFKEIKQNPAGSAYIYSKCSRKVSDDGSDEDCQIVC